MTEERWYEHQLRVRYEETDQMGVVYHANYLTWFEIGRTELIRELGYPYRRIEEKGLLLPLVEADAKFKKPARYDDLIRIYTRVLECSSVRIHFAYEVRKVPEQSSGHQSQAWEPILPNGSTKAEAADNAEHAYTLQGHDAAEPAITAKKPTGELLVSGTTRHVWVNPFWKPVRIEKEAPELWALLTTTST